MGKLFKYILIALILIGAGIGGYLLYDQLSEARFGAETSGYEIEATYTGNSTWEYLIKGALPNPCYETLVRVDDADTGHKIINLLVSPPAGDVICAQVIEPIELTGEFAANRSQVFEFQITTVTPGSLSDNKIDENLFKLSSQYKGENKWDYTIVGDLPNSCYEVTGVSELVAESFPEQVRVQLALEKISEVCDQALVPYDYSGSYSASQNATVELDLIYE